MARVAILAESLTGGGVQKAAFSIAQGLIGRGNAVDLLFLKPVCVWPNDDVPDEMRFFYLTPSIARRRLAARRRELSQSEVLSRSTIHSGTGGCRLAAPACSKRSRG